METVVAEKPLSSATSRIVIVVLSRRLEFGTWRPPLRQIIKSQECSGKVQERNFQKTVAFIETILYNWPAIGQRNKIWPGPLLTSAKSKHHAILLHRRRFGRHQHAHRSH